MSLSILIVVASQRPDSASLRCGRYLEHVALSAGFDRSDILDLGESPLPLWDTALTTNAGHWSGMPVLRKRVQAADAVILVTPEWHGMATPAAKNFLMLCTQKELGHKAGLVVSVSAADNGVYPIAEIRMSGTKNNHLCLIPEQLIFRQVDTLIDADSLCSNEHFDARSRYTVELLAHYSQALKPIRALPGVPSEVFVNGM
ncbi:NADPH-dependent FMN reductase [Saccharospirillum impatiens]|uniref:NADPH-dependent FMN reductase n=1 Tax=Saccharospirillum impatiens TaxID=169438 RepID=UPI000409C2F5|nr:NAD(P)H-dependent oxidoreductase [Saccharospirillum impatiens]